MRARRVKNLPKIAKYAVWAMLLADGVGVYIAHNAINRAPASSSAASEETVFALAEPGREYSSHGLTSSGASDLEAAPATRPFEALPPMVVFKPIMPEIIDEVTPALRVAEAAERGAFVRPLRIAAMRPIGKPDRLFSAAFARDIDGPAQADSSLPDVDFGLVRAEREALQPSSAAYGERLPDVSLSSAETSALELPAEPVAVQAEAADAPVETVPAALDAGAETELPAS